MNRVHPVISVLVGIGIVATIVGDETGRAMATNWLLGVGILVFAYYTNRPKE